MKKIDTIILDLDNTLIDTECIKEYIYTATSRLLNCDEEEARKIYMMTRGAGNKVDFSLGKYRQLLLTQLNSVATGEQEDIVARVDSCLQGIRDKIKDNTEQLVLKGARELIGDCQKRGSRVVIVSLGDENWQREKLELLGLDSYIKQQGEDEIKGGGQKVAAEKGIVELVCTIEGKYGKGKIGVIRMLSGEQQGGEGVVLFNDKPDETDVILRELPALRAFVRWEKKDRRYKEEDFNELSMKFGDRVVCRENIEELRQIFRRSLINGEQEDNNEVCRR